MTGDLAGWPRVDLLEFAVLLLVIAGAIRYYVRKGARGMTPQPVYIRHRVGRCPVCGAPVLDSGYSDDPEQWEHAWTPGTIRGENDVRPPQRLQLRGEGPGPVPAPAVEVRYPPERRPG